MSNVSISQMPDIGTGIGNTAIIPIVQDGLNYTVTQANLAASISGTGGVANISGNLAGNLLANGFSILDLTTLSVNGNIQSGNLSVTGGVRANSVFIGTGLSVIQGSIATGNSLTVANGISVVRGNISINGNIIANVGNTGNISGGNLNMVGNATAAFFIGDGSQLTNLPAVPMWQLTCQHTPAT
jgi:hypothetical protein